MFISVGGLESMVVAKGATVGSNTGSGVRVCVVSGPCDWLGVLSEFVCTFVHDATVRNRIIIKAKTITEPAVIRAAFMNI